MREGPGSDLQRFATPQHWSLAYIAQQDKAIEMIKGDAKQADFASLLSGDLRKTQSDYMKAVTGIVAAVLSVLVGWLIARSVVKQIGGEPDYARDMVAPSSTNP